MDDFEVLLNLDGQSETLDPESGHWFKFEVSRVEATKHRPAGIKYSLTLHDRADNRIFGMDNAHLPKTKRRHRYKAKKISYDHIHKLEKVEDYEFDTPEKLLDDFFEEAYRIIGKK